MLMLMLILMILLMLILLSDSNLREIACLTAVILTPLRVEAALDGSSATPVQLAKRAKLAKEKSMLFIGDLV